MPQLGVALGDLNGPPLEVDAVHLLVLLEQVLLLVHPHLVVLDLRAVLDLRVLVQLAVSQGSEQVGAPQRIASLA